MAAFESKSRAQLDLLKEQQNKLADIEKQQQSIQEQLLKLDKLAKEDSIHRSLEIVKSEIISDLSKQIESNIESNRSFIDKTNESLRQIKVQNDKLSALSQQNEKQIMENNRQTSETVWAEIFNNTIADSKWLTNKTFSPGRWAVGYPYLYVMYRVLNETKPKTILELGLGQSTRMIGQYVAAYTDVIHVVVEHDPEWIAFFENDFQLSSGSRIVQLEREMVAYKDADRVRVYKNFKEHFAGQKYDFISIDAPLGGDMKQYARIDVLTMLPECLSDDFVIMIDDCERVGETNTLKEMTQVLQEHSVKYKMGRYSGKKDCVLICAEHMGFLASM